MSIEFITPNLVSIHGRFVEIYDTREPDELDGELTSAVEELQQLPVRDLEFDLHHGFLPLVEIDTEYAAYQQIPRFIDLARRAAGQHAVSYRNFKVGASVYALSAANHRAGYLFGANLTPHKGAPKRCAEMEVLAKAYKDGYDRIIAIATFGPADYGDVNSVQSPTLHPCAECRKLLNTHPLVQGDTLIITGNEKGDIELMFKDDLIKLHEPK